MDLNLFENLKKDVKTNSTIKNFMEELSDFLKGSLGKEKQKKEENLSDKENTLDEDLKQHRKEGHLYFVTEDRNNEIYLWDFTDKPKHEFKEIISSKELLDVAKEGAMLQYKNGKYELYSSHGYDMLFDEKGKTKDE